MATPKVAAAKAANELRVADARAQDLGRHSARIDPADLTRMNLAVGQFVHHPAVDKHYLRVLPAFPPQRGQTTVQLDWMSRSALGADLGNSIPLLSIECQEAEEIWLAPREGPALTPDQVSYVARWIDGLPLALDHTVCVNLGGRWRELVVRLARPAGPLVVMPQTKFKCVDSAQRSGGATQTTSYQDIGGLEREIEALREIVELPLRYPDVFVQLGVPPPRGVLLHGPPGTGKTLIARAVAGESEASFLSISAPEIVHKFYGESEAKLRELFEKAARQAPCVLFIDEIDAIAARRDVVQGEVEKRIVAQLLTLMDGLGNRGQVIVLAATNLPQMLDPALRRPGRFDRELMIGMPNTDARRAILGVHSRRIPLASDVDLNALARDAKGFTGADLRALCQEAAMRVASRVAQSMRLGNRELPELRVTQADFSTALNSITPTVMRQVEIDVPNTPMSAVGGLEAAKRALSEAILWPLQSPELYAHFGVRPSRGLLLYGPPGTGKTLLAKATASAAQANFLAISGPSLLSRYVGDSERAVRELFARARQAAPVIVFFDEFDALAPARGRHGGSEVSERVVAQLLTEIDGISPRAAIWLLAATNRIDLIDPALLRPGRFDLLVPVGLPELTERREILKVALVGRPLAGATDIEPYAERSAGWSGADLVALIDAAAVLAMRRCFADMSIASTISAADLEQAFVQQCGQRRQPPSDRAPSGPQIVS